jgi:hypothetical protein
MSHPCPRNGCTRAVNDRFLMCPADWRRVPPALQRAVYAAYADGNGPGSPELRAAQDAAVRAVNGEPEPPRPAPHELWAQAGGDREKYRDLLRRHGRLLAPGDEGYDPGAPRALPCGWSPS